MNQEERLKAASEEIQAVLGKYEFALGAELVYGKQGLRATPILIDQKKNDTPSTGDTSGNTPKPNKRSGNPILTP